MKVKKMEPRYKLTVREKEYRILTKALTAYSIKSAVTEDVRKLARSLQADLVAGAEFEIRKD